MDVIFARSACRWLSALVTFCAFSVSSQRSGAPACSERSAISASSRSTPTTERMSAKVERREAIASGEIQLVHIARKPTRREPRPPSGATRRPE